MQGAENALKCVDNGSFEFFFATAILKPTHHIELDRNPVDKVRVSKNQFSNGTT